MFVCVPVMCVCERTGRQPVNSPYNYEYTPSSGFLGRVPYENRRLSFPLGVGSALMSRRCHTNLTLTMHENINKFSAAWNRG